MQLFESGYYRREESPHGEKGTCEKSLSNKRVSKLIFFYYMIIFKKPKKSLDKVKTV